MKKQKIITGLLITALMLGGASGAMAAESNRKADYSITVNNKLIDASPYMLVPVRAVAEAVGFSVEWNDSVQGAALKNDKSEFWVYANKVNEQNISGVLVDSTLYVTAEFFNTIKDHENIVLITTPAVDSTKKTTKEYQTIEELSKAVGYEVKLPAVPEGYEIILMQQVGSNESDVLFKSGDDYIKYSIRLANSSAAIAPEYAVSKEAAIGETSVTLAGNDSIDTVIWSNGPFIHSVSGPKSITESELIAMVKDIAAEKAVPAASGKKVVKEYDTVDEISKAVGYEVKLPDVPKEFEITSMSLAGADEVHISFQNKDNSIFYRIMKADDIVTVQPSCTADKSITIEGKTINVSSNTIFWIDGEYKYTLSFSQQMSENDIANMIKNIL